MAMKDGTYGWQHRSIRSRVSASKPEAAPDAALAPLTTFFNEGCKIDGKLMMKTSIEIEGEFCGEIQCDQTVTVGPAAAIEGNIRARSVVIRGAVVGDVEASREVVLHSSGRLHGDVQTPSFVLERGAFFNGKTTMYRPEIVARSNAVPDLDPAPSVASDSAGL